MDQLYPQYMLPADVQALVGCPQCGAGIGEPCQGVARSNRPARARQRNHAQRVTVAKDARARATPVDETTYKPCWVTRDGAEHPGAVVLWRKSGGTWRALVRYTIELLQYQHWVTAAEIRPREE